jgi:hypothetical protein
LAEFDEKYHDAIGPFLKKLQRNLLKNENALKEVGELMATRIREAMNAEVGLSNGKPYAAWTPRYAKEQGGGTILHKRGSMKDSFKPTLVTKDRVVVSAGGLEINAIKAQWHDGGLARKTKKHKWNRLRLGWNDGLLEEAGNEFLDSVVRG